MKARLTLSLLLATSAAIAQKVPTPKVADQNLRIANQVMAEVLQSYFEKFKPGLDERRRIEQDQAAWAKRVEVGCTVEGDGGALAGSAAALAYAIETQCTADATHDRAAYIRAALKR
jgi:hypothetical protein